ncbi:CgeB family protein [Gulosibacter molinativorax]|uniref:Spore maturation protein n=1 Tax=Gulosibacter molinativorax TaxID=256821 RepID=A0ABT7C7V1_9MICO|nr:glycosyltransferase [Gulosibacter molinativorax]MDJ1371270.1 spore maturation protein [Gulosibacter molinativorax]QUY63670.1 Hypotetical protein [Gulosibacter molinativorax]
MTAKRVLLVSPAFHGYWAAIQAALERLGHDVVTHRYDDAPSPIARYRNALAQRGLGTRQRNRVDVTERTIGLLRETNPQAVLVIKGDDLEPSWWDAVAERKIPVVLWLYDELERMDYSVERLRAIGAVSSYSPNDVSRMRAAGIDAELLPDAYDALTKFVPKHSHAVNFVGARYPERERIVRLLEANGVRVDTYGREWSRHPWDVLRTGQFKPGGGTAYRDIPRAEYYGVMAGSLATLNVHGDGHDGLSMRTFEAPGVGGLQLIDRPSVADYYEPGAESLVYTSDEELVELVQRAQRDAKWAEGIRAAGQRRTLIEHTFVHRMQEVERRWG